MEDGSASEQIDDIIKMHGDWRGEKLSQPRALIKEADHAVVEEVKWKKPSKPEGVPVWSHDGIICMADTLKNAVRLTFPKGAQIKDPKALFNTRLDSKTVRAIDFHTGDTVDEAALKASVSNHQAAAFWRVVLQIADTFSDTLGTAFIPLLTAVPILAFDDTAELASRFMLKVYPHARAEERAAIEGFIMLIPTLATDAEDTKRLEETRDDFIRALDETLIATPAVQQRRADLDQQGDGDADGFPRKPLARGGWVHDLDDDELDRILGRTTNPHDKALTELSQRARTKLGSLTASNVNQTDAGQVLELITELKGALAAHTEADTAWQDMIRDDLIHASSLLICSALFTATSPEWPQLRQNIIDGTGIGAPAFNKEDDDDFAEKGVVHGSAPRASAAQVLLALAAKETDAEHLDEIHGRIRSLAKDTTGAVRASIAGEFHLLWKDPVFAWEIIGQFVNGETHPQVIASLLNSVGRLRRVEPTRATAAIISLYNRCKDSDDVSLRQTAAINLAILYVDQDQPEAKRALNEIIDNPVERYEELERVVVHLREGLVSGISEPANSHARGVRLRTTRLMQEVLTHLANRLSSWRAQHAAQQIGELTDKDEAELKAYRANIETVAVQVYFASGSFDERQGKGGLSDAAKARFIEEQHGLIAQIAAMGEVSAAHHFVEMALAYQDIDPVWALKLVQASIAASVASGAAYESLMASSIATFIKQFIGRHRQYLLDQANQASLMNILDEFVDVGWPEAINLTQDLEDIFR